MKIMIYPIWEVKFTYCVAISDLRKEPPDIRAKWNCYNNCEYLREKSPPNKIGKKTMLKIFKIVLIIIGVDSRIVQRLTPTITGIAGILDGIARRALPSIWSKKPGKNTSPTPTNTTPTTPFLKQYTPSPQNLKQNHISGNTSTPTLQKYSILYPSSSKKYLPLHSLP